MSTSFACCMYGTGRAGVVDIEGPVPNAEIPWPVRVPSDRHEVGQLGVVATELVGGDRSEGWMGQNPDLAIAGVEEIARAAVVTLGRCDASNEGDIPSFVRDLREMLGDSKIALRTDRPSSVHHSRGRVWGPRSRADSALLQAR